MESLNAHLKKKSQQIFLVENMGLSHDSMSSNGSDHCDQLLTLSTRDFFPVSPQSILIFVTMMTTSSSLKQLVPLIRQLQVLIPKKSPPPTYSYTPEQGLIDRLRSKKQVSQASTLKLPTSDFVCKSLCEFSSFQSHFQFSFHFHIENEL